MDHRRLLCVAMLVGVAGGAASGFAQERGLGVGIVFGGPTGLSIKSWLGRTTSANVALAWSTGDNDLLHVQADYVVHRFDIIDVQSGRLPFYYGIGVRARFADHDRLGVRMPIGLDYLLVNAPLDIFAEIVPVLETMPDTELELSAAIGLRFFFR